MIREGMLDVDHKTAIKNYIKACTKGVVKAISKMGISTIQSYGGAQIFEAVGLGRDVIDVYFTGTPSRVAGASLDVIAQEAARRHHRAYPPIATDGKALDVGGNYQWRKDGEQHLFNPESIHRLQTATRNNDYATYKSYAQLINDQSKRHFTLRGLLDFKPDASPIPIDEVEPVERDRQTLPHGRHVLRLHLQGGPRDHRHRHEPPRRPSNSGEGGEDPARNTRDENGDSRRSGIKQVASGRFGVTSEYLTTPLNCRSKWPRAPSPVRAASSPATRSTKSSPHAVRHGKGVGLISPPPHHDIYSIEDLAQLIFDLRNANRDAKISVKLVSEVGVGTVAAGVAKANADVILISGDSGGTGAAPQSSIKHAGCRGSWASPKPSRCSS
jgi:glutamate synthase domain-containing protein 2